MPCNHHVQLAVVIDRRSHVLSSSEYKCQEHSLELHRIPTARQVKLAPRMRWIQWAQSSPAPAQKPTLEESLLMTLISYPDVNEAQKDSFTAHMN